MPSLLEVQRNFAVGLNDLDSSELNVLFATSRLSNSRLFNIYRNNFRSAMSGALGQIYPVIKMLVGAEFFDYLVDRYAADHPSNSGNVQDFGHALPLFLCGFEPVEQLPYLADVARLEWAYHRVFHAPAQQELDRTDFWGLSKQELLGRRLSLAPTSRIVCSPYPIFDIWRMHCRDGNEIKAVSLDQGSQTVLILRQKSEVVLHFLDVARAKLLSDILSNRTLGEVLDTAMLVSPHINWTRMVAEYLKAGILISMSSRQQGSPGDSTDSIRLRHP